MHLAAEIWQHDIVPYLNTGNRIPMHQTRQSIAKSVPQKPVCTPWECVWRPTLCSEKCDTFWSTISQLLENILWFLHGMTDAYDNMVVQFEMGSKLLFWWTRILYLFLRKRDMYVLMHDPLAPVPDATYYYRQVITNYFSKIHSKALKRTRNANTEDEEPFKLQLTIQSQFGQLGQGLGLGQHINLSGLHKAVQYAFCRPQLMHLYDAPQLIRNL